MTAAPHTSQDWLAILDAEGVGGFNARRQAMGYEYLELSDLDLSHRDLSGINLSNARLRDVSLDYAYLAESRLILADIRNASCRETDFYMAMMDESEWVDCDCAGANFQAGGLADASFTRVRAMGARFQDADLSDAILDDCDLDDADFTGASLPGTDLSKARAPWAIFDDCRNDERTRWAPSADVV
ncbi:MAG: pentapeptide repeat-containing protein [Vampirovibrionales bacterium]|nr:pentapeptide repeat-containing protein [Vampirovibrionales bacterium]